MNREEMFKAIDTELQKLSEDEKHFIMWLLLREYEAGIEFPKTLETKQDFAVNRLAEKVRNACNEVIEMLEWELWR